jgi:fructose-specific component phosphotransferase system IIB-like protein
VGRNKYPNEAELAVVVGSTIRNPTRLQPVILQAGKRRYEWDDLSSFFAR